MKEFVGNMEALQRAYAGKGDISVVYAGRVLHVLDKDAIVTLLKDIHQLLEGAHSTAPAVPLYRPA